MARRLLVLGRSLSVRNVLCGVFAAIWLSSITPVAAAADEPSVEFWLEVDTWWRLSPAWRLSLFVPISKNIETHYREGNVVPQVDFAWGEVRHARRLLDENRAQWMRGWLARGGYLGGRSLGDRGEQHTEHTVFTELHRRTPLRGGVLVSHRVRADLRWPGDDQEFSTRWRYRLMVEKEVAVGRSSLVPYVNVEPYYDSRYDSVNRVRLIGGTSVSWSRRWALECNWTYQHDTRSSVTNLHALNLILHIYFETGRAP